MELQQKIFWGAASILLLFGVLLYLTDISNDMISDFIMIAIFAYIVWLCFHNRLTRTFSISALVGLLGWMIGGVPLGLILFVILMVIFWYAWI